MANTITKTLLLNGSRNFILKVDVTGDGSGDETSAEILAPADLTGTPATFKIRSVEWQFNSFDAKLIWDASTDILACALSQNGSCLDFLEKSGAPLINPKTSGYTGKLLLGTVGLGAGDTGTIFIRGYH